MRKINTIILLCSTFSIISFHLSAQNLDFKIVNRLNESSIGLRNFSTFSSKSVIPIAIGVPVTLFAIGIIEKDETFFKDAFYVGVSTVVNVGFTYVLKYSVDRKRPYIAYPNEFEVPYPESSASFPSGHTSMAFATATSLSLKHPRWYVIAPSYLWACSVGYSRMNLGVHYPTDVLVGAVLGAGSAYLTYKINDWLYEKIKPKKIVGLNEYFL